MPKHFPHLLSPYTIGNITFKNRIFAAPQSIPGCYRGWKHHAQLTAQGMSFFLEKAKGGAGCVTVGEIDVSDDFFQAPDEQDLRDMTALAHGIKNYGAVPSIELGCRGSKNYNDNSPDEVLWGPSSMFNPEAGRSRAGGYVTEMTEDDMHELSQRYAQAAEVAAMCGFEMIMIHGGHGFLLSQFLTPLYNKRTDQYGGSIENRSRFPLMVLRAIRERVGNRLLIEYRINADELVEGGLHIDESIPIARLLSRYVDIIHATAGSHLQGADNNTNTSVYKGRTPNLAYAAAMKAELDIPVTTVGAYSDPFEADEVIAGGKADFICFSRQILADAHMPNKLTDGEPEEVNVCIRCSGCMSSPPPDLYAKCSVNPTANYEFLYPPAILPAARPRKVLVIGAGAAGMTAAVTAADRGHLVILAEKSDRMGGIINFADHDFYKERIARWKDNMLRKVEKRRIDVRLGTPGETLIASESPDAVIAALGSTPVIAPIPGIASAIHVLDMYPMPDEKLGNDIVMIGGGLAGCEAALHLTALGHNVTVVEMRSQLAPDAYPLARAAMLENLNSRVRCLTGTTCLEIFPDRVVAENADSGKFTLPADTVVYALGMRSLPVSALYGAAEKRFISVGDCVKPGKIRDAVHTAYFAAMSL